MNVWILAQADPNGTGPATNPNLGDHAAAPGAPATTTTTSQPGSATQPAREEPTFLQQYGMLMIVPIFVVGYFFMTRGPKKEEKKRKAMLEGMKRGDEVETIGGLIGKVVEVSEDRVVVKVDESANVKETYRKAAILRVVSPDDKADEKK